MKRTGAVPRVQPQWSCLFWPWATLRQPIGTRLEPSTHRVCERSPERPDVSPVSLTVNLPTVLCPGVRGDEFMLNVDVVPLLMGRFLYHPLPGPTLLHDTLTTRRTMHVVD